MEISYKPSFVRQFSKLEKDLQEEILEKIELFKDPATHKKLKVHKLKGRLKGRHSFSVNYSHRIVFNFISKEETDFLAIGNHAVYK